MESLLQRAAEVSKEHPKPDITFSYGTAGFRMRADHLDSVMYRMGLLAVLRSKAKEGKVIGVVVTASHNPVHDNGVKLVDPLGEMLQPSWEKHASELANAEDIVEVLRGVVEEHSIDWNVPAKVFIARDTRPSGVEFVKALLDGVQALGGSGRDYGVLSTPQLHYMVRCQNTEGEYGEATEEGYYNKISNAFLDLRSLCGNTGVPVIKLDGANGVGALKVKMLAKQLKGTLSLVICNDGSSGKLNEKCGADYVKLYQCAPDGMDINPGDRCVTFDGDADRVLYFYYDQDHKFHLLDGDRIATLVVGYLKEKLDKTGVVLDRGLGIVQTAYANGNSTSYAESTLGVPVACTKTGVKHVHHKAEEFDIGVYFEANGHGTALFTNDVVRKMKAVVQDTDTSTERSKAAKQVLSLIGLVNQTVGDAMSDMLVVESILHEKGWSLEDWAAVYTDLPNRQRKVAIKNRNVIETTDAERKVTAPQGLQDEIDKLVSGYKNARSFVRPSGTEDIVRVYAEADTREAADSLALAVSQKVYDLAGGIGDRP
ncbi:phosphoacetylglucosamine mutase-like [Porites lutea]|uniref:phosphoacetylglucosamine mutase-like n=1 Tax=Porites lutea TaxID=51062 RepID=UPI003CC6B9AC